MKITHLALTAFAASSSAVAQESLQQWWDGFMISVFPNVTGWEEPLDAAFSRDAKITFNQADHTFDSMKTFFRGVEANVAVNYNFLRITIKDSVAIPGEGLGGLVYATGIEEGELKTTPGVVRQERDAIFAVVNAERKIIEWREATNFV